MAVNTWPVVSGNRIASQNTTAPATSQIIVLSFTPNLPKDIVAHRGLASLRIGGIRLEDEQVQIKLVKGRRSANLDYRTRSEDGQRWNSIFRPERFFF